MIDNISLVEDVYYDQSYCKLNVPDNAELFKFTYNEGNSKFLNISVKRPIVKIKNKQILENYFDLETPYGYGGFYSNNSDIQFLKNAFNQYSEKCYQENIIAEFVRFHPFNFITEKYSSFFDFFSKDRSVVIVDINQTIEERWKNYSSNTRNVLRKCEKNNLHFQKSNNSKLFIEMYYDTMKRNNALDYYYFKVDYFDKLFIRNDAQLFEVIKDDRIIAMGIILFGKEIAHYHLSANTEDSLKLNANYYLLDRTFNYSKEFGKKYFLLGGGRTNNLDDSLFRFKKKFSKDLLDFYISGKIYNQKKYAQYIKTWEDITGNEDVKYFLKYRL